MYDIDKIIISGIITIILTIIIAVTWGNQLSNDKIARMIEAGASPMEAACAVTGQTPHCILADRK